MDGKSTTKDLPMTLTMNMNIEEIIRKFAHPMAKSLNLIYGPVEALVWMLEHRCLTDIYSKINCSSSLIFLMALI